MQCTAAFEHHCAMQTVDIETRRYSDVLWKNGDRPGRKYSLVALAAEAPKSNKQSEKMPDFEI